MVTNNEVIRQTVFSHARVMVIGVGSDLKYMFWYSKEPSHQKGSFEYPQHVFWLTNRKKIVLSYLIWPRHVM